MTKHPRKRGPKPKITDSVKQQIYAILTTGGSLDDAAGYLEIDTATIHRARRRDAKFAAGVKKAVRTGKLKLIQKVGKATAWQAAAWMLERKFGAEFGRRDVIKNEHTGKNGGPIKVEQTDLDRLSTDDLRTYRDLLAKAAAQPNAN
jgi:hypothetical protein